MRRASKWVLAILVAMPVLAVGVGAVYQTVATRRDLAATPAPGRLVNVGSHRLHIWCMGSGTPTVILESGLGGSSFGWARVQPRLAQFAAVCSYDRAGVGYSDAGPAPRTSGRIADELSRLLDSARVQLPVILVAASLGGFSARIFASTQPTRVAGLVLVDASHEDQNRRLAAVGLGSHLPPAFRFIPLVASRAFLGSEAKR